MPIFRAPCGWILWMLGLCAASEARLFGFNSQTSYDGAPKNFQIYWNVPTFMCHKYGMDFRQVSKKYGFVQNEKDAFRGDKIAILYDPGDFPALLKDNKANIVKRNGGVPQEGNLTLHLDYFRRHLIEQIPSSDFSGLGIIDFESWRPMFRQNWASLQIYRDLSLDIERQRHPSWGLRAVQREATERFESSGREFMEKTLELAKKIRPKAQWGYYAYPYCYNWSPHQQSSQCSPKTMEENDGMSWLFGNEKILLPSVYLQHKLGPNQKVGLVRGRVQEAVRLARNSKEPIRVLAYYWYKYQDQRDLDLDMRDIVNTIGEVARSGADGLIIWGSSADLNSRAKCEGFQNYLQQTLGPGVLRAMQRVGYLQPSPREQADEELLSSASLLFKLLFP